MSLLVAPSVANQRPLIAQGVENVYTQHTPHLAETIDLLLKGRLKESSYPYIDGQNISPHGMSRPQDIIIFIVGGTTYEEAKTVAQLNAQFAAGHSLAGSIGPAGPVSQNTRLILGGTCVHNSKRYVTNGARLSSPHARLDGTRALTESTSSDSYSFLEMVRDAAFAFGSSFSAPLPNLSTSVPLNTSFSTSAQPTSPTQSNSTTAAASSQNFNLHLGPVSLNVGGQAGNAIEAGVDAARDGLRDVFGKLRSRVENGVRL